MLLLLVINGQENSLDMLEEYPDDGTCKERDDRNHRPDQKKARRHVGTKRCNRPRVARTSHHSFPASLVRRT
jgi:hypothetical protein